MFLKSMEIFGFKSFADRGRIEFTPGITALLGPNGCGKSNVVDAIKWVLGEQASRSLRAEKMEDVIFNGTEGRKALSVAEVTLTISNEQNVLALDVSEIEVKRRLYRSGESEYFINKTPVKLKELRELFYDTGVGKSAYSVMEQGRIDQVISTKPEERRYLFEEAAGITKYKIRGQEAQRKLERTEDNIKQIESILSEVSKNREGLEKQSHKTTQYRELRKTIFELEKKIQLQKIKNSYEEKLSIDEKLEKKEKEKEAAVESMAFLKEAFDSQMEKVNDAETELLGFQKDVYGINLEKSGLENQEKVQQERLAQLENQSALCESRTKTLKEKLLNLHQSLEQKNTERDNLNERLKECDLNIQSYEKNIETAKRQIVHNEESIHKMDEEIFQTEKKAEVLHSDLAALTDRLVQELDSKLNETGVDWNEVPKIKEQIKKSLKSLEIQFQGRRDFLDSIQKAQRIPKDDIRSFTENMIDDFIQMQEHLGILEDSWKIYEKAVPEFLQEFLSPEGIITQKRELEKRIETNLQNGKNLKEQVKLLQDQNKNLLLTIEEYRKKLEDLKLAQVRMATQIANNGQELLRLHKEVGELELSIQENAREKQEIQTRFDQVVQDLKLLNEKKQALILKDTEYKNKIVDLEKKIKQMHEEISGKDSEIKKALEKQKFIQEDIERLHIRKAEVETQIRSLYDHFRDKHSVDLAEFKNEIDTLEFDGHETELLAEKKLALQTLGQVNLMALEEFAEVDERFQFLRKQLDDLKKAREDLNKVTKEIQKESVLLFERTFEEIKKNFHTVFRRLFGGGRAELKLTEPENVLESGIEVLCQPPGKKLENINLLSGGEKSMTAVALLFATFSVKPSPFCILDEIDAALDESNVGRFVGMLGEFAENSQFIVITHNKKTVTGAKSMIGVTMEDPGISKIISVKLVDSNDGQASA